MLPAWLLHPCPLSLASSSSGQIAVPFLSAARRGRGSIQKGSPEMLVLGWVRRCCSGCGSSESLLFPWVQSRRQRGSAMGDWLDQEG